MSAQNETEQILDNKGCDMTILISVSICWMFVCNSIARIIVEYTNVNIFEKYYA